jgi:hypothetical protein
MFLSTFCHRWRLTDSSRSCKVCYLYWGRGVKFGVFINYMVKGLFHFWICVVRTQCPSKLDSSLFPQFRRNKQSYCRRFHQYYIVVHIANGTELHFT